MSISSPPEFPGFSVIDAPVRRGSGILIQAVNMSAIAPGGRYRPALIISFNPDGFGRHTPPAWLTVGGKVWALRGRGEFARTLRIAPNGPLPLARTPRGTSCRLLIPALDGHPPGGAKMTACDFDFSDGWFDIILPDWHGPRPAVPQPAVSAAAALTPSAPAKPFALAAGTTSHPAWASNKAREQHERAVKGGAA